MERPWRKILYEKQDYSDNYVDTKQFLNGLKRNLHTRTYKFQELAIASGTITQEFSSVCLFVSVFWCVQETWLLPTSLLACSVIVGLSVVGYNSLVFVYQSRHKPLAHFTAVTEYGVSAIVFILFLCAVSPILKTLTEAISTDTIWAMTVGMLSVHLVFHNYGPEQDMVSNSISLNAAIFAAVCLASRLPTTFHVFSIVFFAVGLFALLPQMRKAQHPLVLTVTSVLITTYLLWWASLLLSLVLYTLTVLTITILAPAWLLKLQHLKNNIYGPWDEAVVQ